MHGQKNITIKSVLILLMHSVNMKINRLMFISVPLTYKDHFLRHRQNSPIPYKDQQVKSVRGKNSCLL